MRRKKNIQILLLCCLISTTSISQIRYEDLDKHSKIISEIQYKQQPIIISSSKRSFPVENFKVFFGSKLASFGYYVEDKNGEAIIVTDDMDLSKVTSIYFQQSGDGAEVLTLTFKDNFKIIEAENGNEKTHLKNTISFYYHPDNYKDRAILYESLSELIFLLKKEKNKSNAGNLDNEFNAWKVAIQKNTLKEYSDFERRYPGSVFLKEASNRKELLSIGAAQWFFESYKKGWGRSKKYLELWGNWKPGRSLTEYAGPKKNIREPFQTENLRLSEAPKKYVYYNGNITFDLYFNRLDLYNNNASAWRDQIKIGKWHLFPRGIGINDKKEVVYFTYTSLSNLTDFTKYLGYTYDEVKQAYNNSKEYYWFFDDCTIEYQVVNGQYETTQSVTLYYHDRTKMIPNSSFTFNKDGATYEVSPATWSKMLIRK